MIYDPSNGRTYVVKPTGEGSADVIEISRPASRVGHRYAIRSLVGRVRRGVATRGPWSACCGDTNDRIATCDTRRGAVNAIISAASEPYVEDHHAQRARQSI